MQDLPTVLRSSDLRGLVQTALPLLPQGGGGFGDIEKMLGFVERFIPLLEKFSTSMMAMRQHEAAGPGPVVSDEIWQDDSPPQRAAAPPRQTIQPVAPPAEIDPHRIYAALLGVMAQAPEGMLVSDALILAREHKGMIIPQIEAELKNL
jgi:hypothetical protein